MQLWIQWYRRLWQLRPACSRLRSFLWMTMVLVGLSVRPERAGITSFVRAIGLYPATYHRLLHLFHSTGVDLDLLTSLWTKLVLKLFDPLRVGPYLICLADGIKVPKEGKKMPAVKSLHQSSESNSKAPYIMGHSFQAISLLVRSAAGHVASIGLTARIHEGLVWSNRDKRTLLDKMVTLFLSLSLLWEHPVILVADAYYASKKVCRPLLDRGYHLVTRARVNTVAYQKAVQPKVRTRGRPRLYGKKVRLRDLATQIDRFVTMPSPIYGETNVRLQYRCLDLLWRPIGKLVRFVIVRHPQRGVIFLMTTNTELDPFDVILLYSYRFKIETGFRQAIHVVGSYAYHFWMKAMTPIRRHGKDQYLHMKSEQYRQGVKRKIKAYHLHVQLGCVAQGLLLHLSLNFGDTVWRQFRSWLRTMDPSKPPSELVVAYVLRDSLFDFLAVLAKSPLTRKFMVKYWKRDGTLTYKDAA